MNEIKKYVDILEISINNENDIVYNVNNELNNKKNEIYKLENIVKDNPYIKIYKDEIYNLKNKLNNSNIIICDLKDDIKKKEKENNCEIEKITKNINEKNIQINNINNELNRVKSQKLEKYSMKNIIDELQKQYINENKNKDILEEKLNKIHEKKYNDVKKILYDMYKTQVDMNKLQNEMTDLIYNKIYEFDENINEWPMSEPLNEIQNALKQAMIISSNWTNNDINNNIILNNSKNIKNIINELENAVNDIKDSIIIQKEKNNELCDELQIKNNENLIKNNENLIKNNENLLKNKVHINESKMLYNLQQILKSKLYKIDELQENSTHDLEIYLKEVKNEFEKDMILGVEQMKKKFAFEMTIIREHLDELQEQSILFENGAATREVELKNNIDELKIKIKNDNIRYKDMIVSHDNEIRDLHDECDELNSIINQVKSDNRILREKLKSEKNELKHHIELYESENIENIKFRLKIVEDERDDLLKRCAPDISYVVLSTKISEFFTKLSNKVKKESFNLLKGAKKRYVSSLMTGGVSHIIPTLQIPKSQPIIAKYVQKRIRRDPDENLAGKYRSSDVLKNSILNCSPNTIIAEDDNSQKVQERLYKKFVSAVSNCREEWFKTTSSFAKEVHEQQEMFVFFEKAILGGSNARNYKNISKRHLEHKPTHEIYPERTSINLKASNMSSSDEIGHISYDNTAMRIKQNGHSPIRLRITKRDINQPTYEHKR
eukprot:GHVL01034305.1.p1 GENE.GHVL01034305.1~~GHVL01034305.1.p1  ORF type:complete len:813 (-),score=320.37 GHVL01034305.1:551-2722(-)